MEDLQKQLADRVNEKENLGKELEMLRSRLSSVEVQEWGRMVTEGNLEASGAEMLVPPSGHLQGGGAAAK